MPAEDTFLSIKTVIYDPPDRRYWRSFVYGATKSDVVIESGRATKMLRFEGGSLRYVWDHGDGDYVKSVRHRKIGEKKVLDKDRKYLSRQQSTTLIDPELFNPVPFMSISGGDWVTGVIMHAQKKNVTRIFANDCGTFARFYRSDSMKLLRDEYEQKLKQKDIFRSIDEYLAYLKGCDCYLMSLPPGDQFIQTLQRPAYIFTPNAMFYFDGEKIIKINIPSAKLGELKIKLEIADNMYNGPKALSDKQLQVITSLISGYIRLKSDSSKFSQYNEVMVRLAWEDAVDPAITAEKPADVAVAGELSKKGCEKPELTIGSGGEITGDKGIAASQNGVAFFVDNLPSRLIAQLRAKDLARRLKQQQAERKRLERQADGTSTSVPIYSYVDILDVDSLRLTTIAEDRPQKKKEALIFVDEDSNVSVKVLYGDTVVDHPLCSEGEVAKKILKMISPTLSKSERVSAEKLAKLSAKISSYLRKNQFVKYLLNNSGSAYPEGERTKDIEDGLKSSDPKIRGMAIFLKLEEMNFNYTKFNAECKEWYEALPDKKGKDFDSYLVSCLRENIEELLRIAGDLTYETSELFFQNFAIGVPPNGDPHEAPVEALTDITKSFSDRQNPGTSKRKQKKLDEQERKLFELAVACVSPENFKTLIVNKFPRQTTKYALYDLHLYGILIKSEDELLKPESVARKLFFEVIDDEKIPFDCKRWLSEDKLRFLPAFDLVEKILDRSKKEKKDLLNNCSALVLDKIVGSLMTSIMNGFVPKVSLLKELFSKIFFYIERRGIFEIISCAVKAKNWGALENILNATSTKSILITVYDKLYMDTVISLLENGQIYLLEKLFVKSRFYDSEYEKDIKCTIIERAICLKLCDRYLSSSPPDYQFIRTLYRPAYIFTPDAIFYFDGKESIKVNIILEKLEKLKVKLEITDSDMDNGPKILTDEQLQYITSISNHTHLQDSSVLSRILLFIGPKQLCTTTIKNYFIDSLLKPLRNVTGEEKKEKIKEKIAILANSPLGNISNSIADIFKQIFREMKKFKDLAGDKALVTLLEQMAEQKGISSAALINLRPNLSKPTLLVCAIHQKRLSANSEAFENLVKLAKISNSLDVLQAIPNRFLSFFGIYSYRYKTLLDLAIETKQFDKTLALIRAGAARMSKANANIIMPYAMFEASATSEQLSTILNSTDYKLVLLSPKTVLAHNQIGITKNGEGNLEYQVISPKGKLKLGTIKMGKVTLQLKQAIESSPYDSSLILIKNLKPYLNEILEITSKKGHAQKSGININTKFKGKTALMYAVEQGNPEKVSIILSYDILNIDLKMQKCTSNPTLESAVLLHVEVAKRIQELFRISEQKAQFEEIARYIRENGIAELVKQLGTHDLIAESVPKGLFMQGLVAICCGFSFDDVCGSSPSTAVQGRATTISYTKINGALSVASCRSDKNKLEQRQQSSGNSDDLVPFSSLSQEVGLSGEPSCCIL